MDINKLHEIFDNKVKEDSKIPKKQFIEDVEKASDKIVDALETNGQYMHNQIGCILRSLYEKYGKEAPNYLVELHDLENEVGICKK